MNPDDLEARVCGVGDEDLLLYLRHFLPAPAHTIVERGTARVHGGTFGTVYRFQGKAITAEGPFPWSLILKVVRHTGTEPVDRSRPVSPRYWQREPLAYRSGFLPGLPGPLVAPHCFEVAQTAANEFWVWLEDVGEPEQGPWYTSSPALPPTKRSAQTTKNARAGPLKRRPRSGQRSMTLSWQEQTRHER